MTHICTASILLVSAGLLSANIAAQEDPAHDYPHYKVIDTGSFGGPNSHIHLGLTLASVGLYSVVSYTVLQRTSELGVRVALGARRRDVLSLVALSAGTSVGIGIAEGLA